MGLAASALVLYLRRPIHTIVHPALPHPDAGKCGSQRIHPRERDTQKQEIIVDNDDNRNTTNSLYLEVKSRKAQWEKTALPGFAQQKRIYTEGENPFHDGTARFAQTEKKKTKPLPSGFPTSRKPENMLYMFPIKACPTA